MLVAGHSLQMEFYWNHFIWRLLFIYLKSAFWALLVSSRVLQSQIMLDPARDKTLKLFYTFWEGMGTEGRTQTKE